MQQTLIEKHNFFSEIKFRSKTSLLTLKRAFENLFSPTKKFTDTGSLTNQPVIAVSESILWTTDDNDKNWILTAGKIQNLRLAAQKINGIEVKANEIFSFWKHIGNPNFGKNYVVGREIREGCVIATIAGGMCQLSNALYDAALKANFQIIERHKHTRVIRGSLAELDRDATVKWNYIDLRFKSDKAFRIEVDITTNKLIVSFRSVSKNQTEDPKVGNLFLNASKLNDCYSCGNTTCFKHPGTTYVKQEKGITTYILDDKWSEYDEYIKSVSTPEDFFILPVYKNRFLKSNRYNWTIGNPKNVKTNVLAAIKRAILLRVNSKLKRNPFSRMITLDKEVAISASRQIPVESTHIVVSQNLLPFLFEQNALGGRTYDVLMTRLPIEKLHQRLDEAYKNHPESKTLNDFRAPQSLIDLENRALTKARNIITPHKEIADIFINKSTKLEWSVPSKSSKEIIKGNKILFPATSRGRKGSHEIKKLAQELNLTVVIPGTADKEDEFWKDVNVEYLQSTSFNEIGLIVYPAHVEHQPRLILKAISYGIPVIVTSACGLSQGKNVSVVPTGNYQALKEEVTKKLIELNFK